jgi:hypothetical protein
MLSFPLSVLAAWLFLYPFWLRGFSFLRFGCVVFPFYVLAAWFFFLRFGCVALPLYVLAALLFLSTF